jgi:hypothetical protein
VRRPTKGTSLEHAKEELPLMPVTDPSCSLKNGPSCRPLLLSSLGPCAFHMIRNLGDPSTISIWAPRDKGVAGENSNACPTSASFTDNEETATYIVSHNRQALKNQLSAC